VTFTSSLELPYTIKRSGDSLPSKDRNGAKKPVSPPPTLAAASSTAPTVQRRKSASASKGKSSGWSTLLPSSVLLTSSVVSFDNSVAVFASHFVRLLLLSFHCSRVSQFILLTTLLSN